MQMTNQSWGRVHPCGFCWQTHLYRFRCIDIGAGETVIATDIENALVLAGAIINAYAHLPNSMRAAHLERPFAEALDTYVKLNQSST